MIGIRVLILWQAWRRSVLVLFGAFLLAIVTTGLQARAEPRVDVYLFWSADCPHCQRAMAFLERLERADKRLVVHRFEVTRSADDRALLRRAIELFEVATPLLPMIIIGERVLIGYRDDATTGQAISDLVQACLAQSCPDRMRALLADRAADVVAGEAAPFPKTITLPVLGEIPTASLSLPILTIVLAALDGFNPCAMWVLVFLIGLLLGLRDRTRMWLLGSTFLLASAAIYFAFLAAWLNVLLVLGALTALRVAIGLVAMAGGAHYLWEYGRSPEAACKVAAPERRRRTFDRLKEAIQRRNLAWALVGVAVLAIAVNVVELLCSAGLPAIYTAVLTRTPLPAWQYYLYLVLYVAVFLIDDMAVFVTAMMTVKIAMGTSYARYARPIGGAVLLVIGALLVLRPDLLMFGGA